MVRSSVANRSSICVWVSRLGIPSSPPPSPSGAADARPGATTVTNIVRALNTRSLRIIVNPSFSLLVMQKWTGNKSERIFSESRKAAFPYSSLVKGRIWRRAYARRANILLVRDERVALGPPQPTAGLCEEQAACDKIRGHIVMQGNGVS